MSSSVYQRVFLSKSSFKRLISALLEQLNTNVHGISIPPHSQLFVVTSAASHMASGRMRKKIKDYAEIFGHIMQKHALIMRKLHRIMQKLKQVIKLIIRPVQCIYMLTVNP